MIALVLLLDHTYRKTSYINYAISFKGFGRHTTFYVFKQDKLSCFHFFLLELQLFSFFLAYFRSMVWHLSIEFIWSWRDERKRQLRCWYRFISAKPNVVLRYCISVAWKYIFYEIVSRSDISWFVISLYSLYDYDNAFECDAVELNMSSALLFIFYSSLLTTQCPE